jgi:hypothetical protein
LPDDRQIAWASPSAVAKHCPIFVKPKQPSSVAPRTANNARIIEEQEARIEELEQELESARQGKAKPSKAALDVLTWHDLIQRAIAVLRAMPEDSRHEAMNQWSSQIALSVTFPGKAPARKARTVRPAAPAMEGVPKPGKYQGRS